MRPREFSIASACGQMARGCTQAEEGSRRNAIELCVAIVDYRTPYGRRCRGVCSSWLASLRLGAAVPILLRRGSMRLDLSSAHAAAAPLLCIGAGTGVAPLRALLWEKRMALDAFRDKGEEETEKGGLPPADTLVFGSRHREKDFLYAEEFATLCAGKRPPLRCALAFSRDAPSLGKVYVQHVLRGKKPGLRMGRWGGEGGNKAAAAGAAAAEASSGQEKKQELGIRPLPLDAAAVADVVWDAIKPAAQGVGSGETERRARVFVAGNSSLPGAVFSALGHVALVRGDFVSHGAALKFVKDLERQRVIVVESWS